MPIKNIIPSQTVTKEKLQRTPSALSGTSPKWDDETYTFLQIIFMSHLGEDGWGRFRNEEVMKNLSAVVGNVRELVT